MPSHPQFSATVLLREVEATAAESTLAEARELLLEYGRFVVAQPGAARFCLGSLEQEAARLPSSFQEQGGGCLMAHVNNTSRLCGVARD
jgi:hypothetical protein